MALSYEEIILDAEERMDGALNVLTDRFKGIRTGRASPALLEGIKVEYYGTQTPLKQLANIAVPEPRMLVVKPYDASSVKAIETAIQKSDLGINPSSDGKILRLQFPPLSEERRRQLVGQVKEMGEEARVAVRNIRRDANKHIDASKADGTLAEDQAKDAKDQVQEMTHQHETRISELLEKKSAAILE